MKSRKKEQRREHSNQKDAEDAGKAVQGQCQQKESIEVPKTYFDNMQKWLDDLVPNLDIADIATMKKFLRIYDWLDYQKLKKEIQTFHNTHQP